jgi:hypothetical protein
MDPDESRPPAFYDDLDEVLARREAELDAESLLGDFL